MLHLASFFKSQCAAGELWPENEKSVLLMSNGVLGKESAYNNGVLNEEENFYLLSIRHE